MSEAEGTQKRTTRLALLAAAFVGLQVGAATVASRYALLETDPLSLAFWRYLIGALSLLPFVLWTRSLPRFALKDVLPVAVLGIVQFAVLVALLNVSLLYISSGRAALVFSAFPLLTMLLAAILGRERMTVRKSLGVVITMIGVGVAIGSKAAGESEGFLGEAIALGAAFCGAVCSVLYRPYLERYPALGVSGFAMLASVIFLAVAAFVRGGLVNIVGLPFPIVMAVIFIGLSSGIAYFVLLWALKHSTPTRVTMFQALAPLTATGLGIAMLGEMVTPNFLAGLFIVVLGLVVALWSRSPRAAPASVPDQPPAGGNQ